MLQDNLRAVNEKIGGRARLVAVSKFNPPEIINEAIELGVTDIGESRVQELLEKYDALKPVRIHFIGHLQTNKVKALMGKVDLIQSVDSVHLAECIDKRAEEAGIVQDILLQINITREESKFGIFKEDVDEVAERVHQMKNIRVRGLMYIAPETDDPENVRPYFRQMKDIFDRLAPSFGKDFDILSMGMSSDYGVAIEEGATHVRVGTAIFGARDYSK